MHLNLAMDFGKYLPESVGVVKIGIIRKYKIFWMISIDLL